MGEILISPFNHRQPMPSRRHILSNLSEVLNPSALRFNFKKLAKKMRDSNLNLDVVEKLAAYCQEIYPSEICMFLL